MESRCFARSSLIGAVVINDPKKSITKEAANRYFKTNDVGVGITEIKSLVTIVNADCFHLPLVTFLSHLMTSWHWAK